MAMCSVEAGPEMLVFEQCYMQHNDVRSLTFLIGWSVIIRDNVSVLETQKVPCPAGAVADHLISASGFSA